MAKIRSHRDLEVYQMGFQAAMEIYHLSKSFPKEEIYALTDQIRRSSRSVTANLAEGFRKRRYPKSFSAKMVDCEAEASETQTWLDYALACAYIDVEDHLRLFQTYDHIIGKLVVMGLNPGNWTY